MVEPSHPGSIEPGGGAGRAVLWLGLLLVLLLALAYATDDVPPTVFVATLLLAVGILFVARLVHRRRSREQEAAVSGAPRPGTPVHEVVAGLVLTALYLLFVFFSDEILADVSSVIAAWLEGLGLRREETAEIVETLFGIVIFLFVVSGWIGSWRERRTRQVAERALAYGEDPESRAE
jgi:hypothetical protein